MRFFYLIKKPCRVEVRLTPYLYRKLQEIADFEEITMAEVMREALRDKIKGKEGINSGC